MYLFFSDNFPTDNSVLHLRKKLLPTDQAAWQCKKNKSNFRYFCREKTLTYLRFELKLYSVQFKVNDSKEADSYQRLTLFVTPWDPDWFLPDQITKAHTLGTENLILSYIDSNF